MNDFSELEKELRKLRPTQPSPMLFERVGEALKNCRAPVSDAKWKRWRFTETPYSGWSLGFGLAAAAVLILFAAVTMCFPFFAPALACDADVGFRSKFSCVA